MKKIKIPKQRTQLEVLKSIRKETPPASKRFKDRKKEQARKACRGKRWES